MKFPIAVVLSITLSTGIKVKAEKPNVILFVVDDMGWTDLGCYGSDLHQTPHIDRLASKAFLFTDAYSSCNVCSPSRASIMTGQYPARLHLTDWIEGHKYPWAKLKVPDWNMKLDQKEHTIAEAFLKAGYTTAHFGKWHLGEKEENWPEHHGFQTNIGGWAKGAPHKNKERGYNGYFSPFGNPRIEGEKEDEYLTEYLTQQVCRHIEEQQSNHQPFFINFWLYNVHMPLQARQEKIEKYNALIKPNGHHKNAVYAAMVEHTDDALGAIVQTLKKLNIDDNTIILFTSDNGGLTGKGKNPPTKNTPLRDGKGTMYEGGIRIPTILYIPNMLSKTKMITTPVISADYYPTLAALAGIETQGLIDGKDWSPLLHDQKLDRTSLFWHYPHYHQQGAVPHSIIRQGDWKLIQNFETDEYELYNLKTDIGESQNLIDSEIDKAAELKVALHKWRRNVGAQYPEPNDNFIPEKRRKKNPKQTK